MLFLSGSVSLLLKRNEKMKEIEEIEQLLEEKRSFKIGSSTTCQNTFFPIGDTGRFGIECQMIVRGEQSHFGINNLKNIP